MQTIDTAALINGNNLHELIATLNNELKLVTEWRRANKLTLNISKKYYMIFHRSILKTNTVKI